ALWTFAFVTGLSASVLRAVTMFSLFALAKAMGRGDNIYNTLAAAALILLLIDPYLIMSVGFQLSFLAVLGIVSITRGVYELWLPKYLFIDKVWQISCVAFAAQLSTFALGMLYFHQFPSFFFFSNLFVIPGAFVILLSGLACLLLSPVHELAAIIGGITEVCIWFINQVVFFIEVLPYSKINHIYIDTSQTWLLLLLIAALVTFFYQHNLGWLKLAFSMAIVLSLSVWVHFYQARKNPQLTFYKVNGLMALDWIENGNAYFFKDDVEWYDAERIRFHIRPNRLANSVHSIHTIGHTNLISTDWADVLQVKDKSICLIRQSPHNLAAQVHVDFVVLDKSWKGKLSELNERLSFEKLIISTAINHQRAAKLQQEALDLGIDFYNVHQQGALTIKL
ncbi:MAG TPA: ComEC/Rec2 family competence protein, partial [Cyclobacteriaceae bacterium]|nr:ComEC/Rec2 family competence protein [Cyclobacteriaceae bacterium]